MMMNGACGQIDVLALLLVALLAVRRWARRACRRCGTIDRRKWGFCPRCGWPRCGGEGPVAEAATTETVTVAPLTGGPIPVLPTELLRRGWCREPALDEAGGEVSPTSAMAVAWSISGACDRAFEPHSAAWRAWRQGLEDSLRERYGGVSACVWNQHPSRRRATVLAVAEEVKRRIGLARGRPKGSSDR